MGTVKVTNIEPIADNGTVTLGGSGDTITLGSGATVTGTGLVGITMSDDWRLTASTNSGTNADVTTNWERVDSGTYGRIGTGLTESSGVFSFPQTGIYLIHYVAMMTAAASDTTCTLLLKTTSDNSSYSDRTQARGGNPDASNNVSTSGSNTFAFDVTDITTHKFKFATTSFSSGTDLMGNTSVTRTGFNVIRLGDT